MKLAPITTPLVVAAAQTTLPYPPQAGVNCVALPAGWQGLPVSQGNNAFAWQLAQGGGGCIPQIDLGDGPIAYTGGTLPASLQAQNAAGGFYVVPVASGTYKLADSLAHALAGVTLAISDNGTGTIDDAGSAATMRLHWASLGLAPGDDGTAGDVSLDAQLAKTFTVPNRARFLAIALSATVGSGTAHVTVNAYPVEQLAS